MLGSILRRNNIANLIAPSVDAYRGYHNTGAFYRRFGRRHLLQALGPSFREPTLKHVVISGLPESTSHWSEIQMHMEKTGKVLYARCVRYRGEKLGFVRYESVEAAVDAVKELSGSKFQDSIITVKHFNGLRKQPQPEKFFYWKPFRLRKYNVGKRKVSRSLFVKLQRSYFEKLRSIENERRFYHLVRTRNNAANSVFPQRSVIVRGIPAHVSWEELTQHMSIAGQIVGGGFLFHTDLSKSGRAIVEYSDHRVIENVVKMLHMSKLGNALIAVKQDLGKAGITQSRSTKIKRKQEKLLLKYDIFPNIVFIRNLPLDFSDSHIWSLCQHFGPVKRAITMRNENGDSMGSALVEFELNSSADLAISKLDRLFFDGRFLSVRIFRRK